MKRVMRLMILGILQVHIAPSIYDDAAIVYQWILWLCHAFLKTHLGDIYIKDSIK